MEQALRIIQNTHSLAGIAQIQANATARGRLTEELQAALDTRAGELGREYLRDQTGLAMDALSPAEEKIVKAVSIYVGMKVRDGSNANLTIRQIKNRGLLAAAEAAVDKAQPTAGFETLRDAGLDDLSYERIILDHPEEFSSRAQWHARRTLGLPNTLPKAPPRGGTPIQEQTERLLDWMSARRDPDGKIPAFTNAEAAAALGWTDLQVFGRAYGNLQSRLDFACYRIGLPPLGLSAEKPFAKAWGQEQRSWPFPVTEMQVAAQSRAWSKSDFDHVRAEASALPGQAHIAWHEAFASAEADVRAWAEGLAPNTGNADPAGVVDGLAPAVATSRNPTWSREELILALDLYLALAGSPFNKTDERIVELSSVLGALAMSRGISGQSDFRNANGVHMLMNFRSLDPAYTSDGRVGLTRGNRLEAVLWEEFSNDREALTKAVGEIRQSLAFTPAAAADEADLRAVLAMLDVAVDDVAAAVPIPAVTPEQLADIEAKYRSASPEAKERVSRTIERGPVGALVKKANGYRCQVCEALGLDPIGFRKSSGEPYVEAHHVMPVSRGEIGSLAASNILTACPNHHRQLHFGQVEVCITPLTFEITLDGQRLSVRRPAVSGDT